MEYLTLVGSYILLQNDKRDLEGFPAVSVHYRKKTGGAAIETQEIVVFRNHPKDLGSLFYVIWLRTPSSHYEEDHKLFEQVRDGFHLLPGPQGKCSND